MLNMTYLAILESQEDGSYHVFFPDLPGCFSSGISWSDAQQNAADAASLYIYGIECDKQKIPMPSPYLTKETINGNNVMLVTIQPNLVRIKKDTERVRTNITLPAWLKRIAEEQKVNYSRLLETALLEYLHIPRNKSR